MALIQGGAKVDAKEIDGWSPLHISAQNGTKKIAEILIQNDATVDIKNNDEFTPLLIAIENRNLLQVLQFFFSSIIFNSFIKL